MKYFLHDTNAFADEKVTKVFMKYGYEGVGLFFCVLEKLAFQEKPIETKVLKKQLFVDKKMLPLWKFLFEVGLLEEKNGETFNNRVMNVSEKYIVRKEKSKKRIAEWRANKEGNENVTRYTECTEHVTPHITECVRTPPKENKTKEKERKENDDEGKASTAVIEKIVEHNITNNNISLKEGVHITELKTKVFKDVRFCLEFDGMGVPVEHLEGWLESFNGWLEYTGETVKQEKDYRAHFKSWLLKQPYKTADPNTFNPVDGKAVNTRHDAAEELLKKRYGP
jgi:hypothetical protein